VRAFTPSAWGSRLRATSKSWQAIGSSTRNPADAQRTFDLLGSQDKNCSGSRTPHDASKTEAKAFPEVDARVAIASLRSLESQIAVDTAPLWMLATLLTLFATGSLLIAPIGQYAVVAFDGRRRSREFGVRIALGASSRQLVSSVVAESFRLTVLGLVTGFA
jgi:hypothetical protein